MPSVARVVSAIAAVVAVLLFLGGAWVVVYRVGSVFDPNRAEQLTAQSGPPDQGGWLLMTAAVFAAGRYLLPLAVGLSGAIAGERFRLTLDVLLSRLRQPLWEWRSPLTAGFASVWQRPR
jgi:hypothetical protein